jgi:hypothetical protein
MGPPVAVVDLDVAVVKVRQPVARAAQVGEVGIGHGVPSGSGVAAEPGAGVGDDGVEGGGGGFGESAGVVEVGGG